MSSASAEGTDRRLSIAIVSEPGKAGVKTHVIDVLSNVDVAEFKITFFYSLRRSDSAYPEEIAALRARGIECCELPMEPELHLFEDFRALTRLVVRLRKEPPTILHLHSSKAGGLGRLASFFVRPRPRVIYTPNAMACYRSYIYLWLERVLGLLTDTLVAVSASEREDFIRWRIPKAREAETITLGVQPLANPGEVLTGRTPHPMWTVGACGRISHQKNALFFFQLALFSLKNQAGYRFKWIGDFGVDAESKAVRELLSEAGNPPEIEVTGWTLDPQAHLRLLDAFCMFSRYESFGYVTAEAMLLGIPVIATAATGTVDLVRHEQTGLLVEASLDSAAAALHRLKMNPELGVRLATEGRRLIAESHTVTGMVQQWEALYHRVGSLRTPLVV